MKPYPMYEEIGDEFEALLCNLFALEYGKLQDAQDHRLSHPPISHGDTLVHYHAGTMKLRFNQKEPMTIPIHLAHTHGFALILDEHTEEVVLDFRLSHDVFMIMKRKKALWIRRGDQIGLIVLDHQEVFDQLLVKIPMKHLIILESELEGWCSQ